MNRLAASTIAHIQTHWAEPMTTQGLAAALAVPVGRLIAHCKRATGVTPYQMLLDARIAHAKTLLRTTTQTCAMIGQEVGFSDPSQFGRMFRRKTGLTPEHYRAALVVERPAVRLAVVMALWDQVGEETQRAIVAQVEAAVSAHNPKP